MTTSKPVSRFPSINDLRRMKAEHRPHDEVRDKLKEYLGKAAPCPTMSLEDDGDVDDLDQAVNYLEQRASEVAELLRFQSEEL